MTSQRYLRVYKEAVDVVREVLNTDNTWKDRTDLNANHVCDLLELCLNTNYFVYNGKFYKQYHDCHGFTSIPYCSETVLNRRGCRGLLGGGNFQ